MDGSPRLLEKAAIVQEFVSEPLTPVSGQFITADMARGLPGLPAAFEWRGQRVDVAQVIGQWKQSSREGGHAGGELYLRRHYYRLRMSDGAIWVVYLARQTPKSGSPKRRWFLYALEQDSGPQAGGGA